jgi:hypothetical protein
MSGPRECNGACECCRSDSTSVIPTDIRILQSHLLDENRSAVAVDIQFGYPATVGAIIEFELVNSATQ